MIFYIARVAVRQGKTNENKKRLLFSDVLIGGAFLLGVGLIKWPSR